jgi:hypothetical protein
MVPVTALRVVSTTVRTFAVRLGIELARRVVLLEALHTVPPGRRPAG